MESFNLTITISSGGSEFGHLVVDLFLLASLGTVLKEIPDPSIWQSLLG
jgi:hypothetical protein